MWDCLEPNGWLLDERGGFVKNEAFTAWVFFVASFRFVCFAVWLGLRQLTFGPTVSTGAFSHTRSKLEVPILGKRCV